MALLGRKNDKSGASRADQRDLERLQAAITAFWAWWPQAGARIEGGADIAGDLANEITEHVHAINQGLAWEIAQPAGSPRRLVVTAGGIAELRSVAERWARGAPSDPGWRYLPAKPADPAVLDAVFELSSGWKAPLAQTELAVRVNQRRAVVDLVVYHPLFGDIVDTQPRMELAMIALDGLLGEDGVERWVGSIDIATERPLDCIPATTLPSVVEQLEQMYTEPRWALLSGSTPTGLPLVATARFPLRRVDYPLFDQHVAVVLPYRDRTEQRLPAGSALDALNAFEEDLVARLGEAAGESEGEGAAAALVAHESANGRRIMHLYADSAAQVLPVITELARGWQDGRAKVAVTADPAWANVRHLRA